jgi:hypothetical protein
LQQCAPCPTELGGDHTTPPRRANKQQANDARSI